MDFGFCSEPVYAKSGKHAGTRVFKPEEEQGLAVIRAPSAEQRGRAILSRDLPREPFTTAFRTTLNYAMKEFITRRFPAPARPLVRLVDVHVSRMRPGHAEIKMAEVRQHLRQTYFAWMGGAEKDSVFYYRIHSPVIIIEFDHQRGSDTPTPIS